jgi:hypothetical protein
MLGGSLMTPSLVSAAEAAEKPDPETVLRETLIARCEKQWTRNFVPMAKAKLPANDPANDESRKVVLDLVADKKGKILSVDVGTSSGAESLDQAARDIALESGPISKLDSKLLSDDGNLHALWVFARKDGVCSDLQVRAITMPAEQAIPTLLTQGRDDRALERLAEAVAEGNDKAISVFGQHWLKRASNGKDKNVGLAALATLAESGNREAATQLVALAEAGNLPPAYWTHLARSGHSVCTVAQKALAETAPDARLAALRALGIQFDKACLPAVAAVAVDTKANADERVLALAVLATTSGEEARAASRKAMNDTQPKVRAAAIRSWAQADQGLKALYGLTAIMKEPNVLVRAAINAGIVRSSGDKGLEQLYLVFKEKDPAIYEALSDELGQMNTEASAEMLRRFLKRDEPKIRRFAAMALGRRTDRFARAVSATFVSETDVAMKVLAIHAMQPAEIESVVAGVDAKSARWVYGVLLDAGLRAIAAKQTLNVWGTLNDDSRMEWISTWLRAAEPPSKIASSKP